MGVTKTSGEKPVTLLLPWYLVSVFSEIFEHIGFRVLWSETPEELHRMLDGAAIDIALEWQHGPDDYPVRDLLRARGVDVPIFLCLNWRKRPPGDLRDLGYVGWLRVPFQVLPMLRLFMMALPAERGPAMEVLMNNAEMGWGPGDVGGKGIVLRFPPPLRRRR